MSRVNAAWACLAAAVLALGFLLDAGAGGEKLPGPWKVMLPPEVYKELLSRELKSVQAAIGADKERDIQKGKVAALMIVGYTFSTKDAAPDAIRAAAWRLAEILGDKDKVAESKKLMESIASGKGDDAIKNDEPSFRKYVQKEYDLMVMYMGKEKGGDGLHPELAQLSNTLTGTQEFIENLFAYLSKKPLPEVKVKKGAKELELVGYRTAVSAEVILAYTPKNKTKKRDPEIWLQTGTVMRDSALDLAAAAKKLDAEGIHKSSDTLIRSCVNCHKMFQK